MIYHEVLNHMEADELRNLVRHLLNVVEAKEKLTFAQADVIGSLEALYRDRERMESCRINLDCKMGSLRNMQNILEQKYDEFMPRPTCEPLEMCGET